MRRLVKASGKTAAVLSAMLVLAFVLADSKPVASQEKEGAPSTQQIRQAAQKGLAILEVTNKDWVQTGYCNSCHHDTLLIRTTTIARGARQPIPCRPFAITCPIDWTKRSQRVSRVPNAGC